jgi:hypothetical protein
VLGEERGKKVSSANSKRVYDACFGPNAR